MIDGHKPLHTSRVHKEVFIVTLNLLIYTGKSCKTTEGVNISWSVEKLRWLMTDFHQKLLPIYIARSSKHMLPQIHFFLKIEWFNIYSHSHQYKTMNKDNPKLLFLKLTKSQKSLWVFQDANMALVPKFIKRRKT